MHRKIPLPRGWRHRPKSAILHILALSHYAFTAFLTRTARVRDHLAFRVRPRGSPDAGADEVFGRVYWSSDSALTYGRVAILFTAYLFEVERNGQREVTSGRGTVVFGEEHLRSPSGPIVWFE